MRLYIFADIFGDAGSNALKGGKCLPYDLQFPLHCRTESPVLLQVLKALFLAEFLKKPCRVQHVMDIFVWIMRHIQLSGWLPGFV